MIAERNERITAPGCIRSLEKLSGCTLREILCPEAERLEQLLKAVPESLRSAHFDVAAALGTSEEATAVIELQAQSG